jgi:hypothetical protein
MKKRKKRTSIYSAVSSSSLSSSSGSSASSEDDEKKESIDKNLRNGSSPSGYKAKTETISDLETISNADSRDNSPIRPCNNENVAERAWRYRSFRAKNERGSAKPEYSSKTYKNFHQYNSNYYENKQLNFKNISHLKNNHINNHGRPSIQSICNSQSYADSNQNKSSYRQSSVGYQTVFNRSFKSNFQTHDDESTDRTYETTSLKCPSSTSQFYYHNYNNKHNSNNANSNRHCYYENGDLKATITSTLKSNKKIKSTSASSAS